MAIKDVIGEVGRSSALGIFALAAVSVEEASASSSNIRQNLRDAPGLVRLSLPVQYRNAVDALVDSAARAIPIPAASSAFTYRRDPATGEYERTSETFGPSIFMERPQTLGRNVWHLGVSGQYLELDEFDGERVGTDPYPVLVDGEAIRFQARPKFVYHVATVQATYGVLNDLDVNLAVPLVALDADVNAFRQSASGGPFFVNTQHGHVSLGVADMLLRAKYHLGDWERLSAAAGVIMRLPSGDTDEALGTGDVELGPYVAVSALFWDRVEPQWNAGFDFDLADSHLSSAHYAFGVNVLACRWAAFAFSLLGRSEVDGRRAAANVSGPHLTPSGPANTPYDGLNFDRKDYFDAAIGARLRLWRTFLFSVNVLKALNDDGLRSGEWSPVGSLEATF